MGFLGIAHPITSLQRKGNNFQWTEECEKRFQQLKKLLTSASIMNIANLDKYFIVFTKECKEGLGGVLSQDRFVICF
jgi:hypothetical protein